MSKEFKKLMGKLVSELDEKQVLAILTNGLRKLEANTPVKNPDRERYYQLYKECYKLFSDNY